MGLLKAIDVDSLTEIEQDELAESIAEQYRLRRPQMLRSRTWKSENRNSTGNDVSEDNRDYRRDSEDQSDGSAQRGMSVTQGWVCPVTHLSIQGSPVDRRVDVLPTHKLLLPSLNIRNIGSNPATPHYDSIAQSPGLSRYAISPQDFNHSQTLARIQSYPSPHLSQASPAEFKQTLPSLETALSSVSDMPPRLYRTAFLNTVSS